jgi:hypothetical protein
MCGKRARVPARMLMCMKVVRSIDARWHYCGTVWCRTSEGLHACSFLALAMRGPDAQPADSQGGLSPPSTDGGQLACGGALERVPMHRTSALRSIPLGAIRSTRQQTMPRRTSGIDGYGSSPPHPPSSIWDRCARGHQEPQGASGPHAGTCGTSTNECPSTYLRRCLAQIPCM